MNATECIITIEAYYGHETELSITRTTYQNGNLAVIATECETGEPWATLTINTDTILPENMACVDSNNIENIQSELTQSGIAKPTGMTINPGGFVDYPVMAFDLNKIPEAE